MHESKDLNKLEFHDLFANLKAYEFELETRAEATPSTSQPIKALAATTIEQCSPSTSKTADQLSDDAMSLFVKKFGKYLRRSYNPSTPYNKFHKSDKVNTDLNCYNCGRPGNFTDDCNRPKKEDRSRDDKRTDDRYKRDDMKEDRYKRDDKTDERTVDRSKDRSKDRRMRTRGDKRPNRKNDRKVLMAEESTKSWADTDSDSSSNSSSSSDSEQKEVHCLMADQTSDDEVFDFSNINLHEKTLLVHLMIWSKSIGSFLTHLRKSKAEKENLKNSSIESSTDTLEDIDSFKIDLSKLMMENELLRNESSELNAEIEKSNLTMSSWAKSSASLDNLFGIQKPTNDRTGLGFNSSDSSEGETSTQSQLVYEKSNKMSFVKANVIYDPCESMTYNDQTPQKLNHKVKAGIGIQRPDNSKSSWLKNKLDKDKEKAGQKSFVPNQPWRSSTKVSWNKILFNIMKDMVTAETRQARGYAIQISLMLENIPNLELGESTEFPSSKILIEKTVHRYIILNEKVGGEDVKDAPRVKRTPVKRVVSKKRSATVDTEAAPIAETAAGSVTVEIIVESVAEPISEPAVADVVNERPSTTDEVDDIIQQVLTETAQIGADKEEIDGGGETVSGSAVGRIDGRIEEKLVSADEEMSLEDILMSILVDVPLPSAGMEITKISLGKSIKIPGIDERTWYMAILPQILVDDKGKKPLQEKDPVKGNPVKEQILLIVADIDLLVQLREKIINEVAKFFYSFSFKRLANLKIDDSYFAKEELVLSWAEAESTGVALQRRIYILMKYRELLIRKFLEEKPCCSRVFEGVVRDRGVVIARSNTNFPSNCWIRTKTMVDGSLVIQEGPDMWETIPSCQCILQVDEKDMADVCLEVCEFFASGKLLPVGSVNFCQTLSAIEPVSHFFSRQPTVFSLRLSQLYTAFVRYSLFAGMHTDDIRSFLSTIAMDRTVLRNLQIVQNSVSVATNAQLCLDQHPHSSSTSTDSSLHFDDNEIRVEYEVASPHIPLPAVASNITETLAQIRDSVDQIRFDQIRRKDDVDRLRDTLLMHIRDIEKKSTERFDELNRVNRASRIDSQDIRTVLSLDIRSSQKQLSAQIVAAAIDNVDVRRAVKEINAKIDDLDRGGDAKKGEGSSSRPQPPPDDHSGAQGQSRTGGSGSGAQGQSRPSLGSGISQSRENRSGSSKRRSSGGESPVRNVRYGPYPPTGVPKRSAKHCITGEKDF
ncbi:hypothetical protein F511_07142 [Dorcoceras hygrometricum]|nr:hypothetical protein F511_07142 [Dorcoceras hygrometricum]